MADKALTAVTDDQTAHLIVAALHDRIVDRTVVEVGAGLRLLALHMRTIAKRVFAIEASPVWSSAFLEVLMDAKLRNVSFICGDAEEFVGTIKADVSLFCSHSGIALLRGIAERLGTEVIDVYGEMIEANPAAFDSLALMLRRES